MDKTQESCDAKANKKGGNAKRSLEDSCENGDNGIK